VTTPASKAGATRPDDSQDRRAKPGWRGWLTGVLMGAAGGMAINDASSTVGYRGLAGIVAAAGVMAATTWIRRLDARAWLPRYAPWLFLTPAAAVAVAAAFSPGPLSGILTAVTVVLTAGAVLLTTGLEAAGWLLGYAAVIGAGVALIGGGSGGLCVRLALYGVAIIGAGVALIGFGVAVLTDRPVLLGAAFIGAGVAVIGFGVATLGPAAIGSGVRRMIDAATKAPQIHQDRESLNPDAK